MQKEWLIYTNIDHLIYTIVDIVIFVISTLFFFYAIHKAKHKVISQILKTQALKILQYVF